MNQISGFSFSPQCSFSFAFSFYQEIANELSAKFLCCSQRLLNYAKFAQKDDKSREKVEKFTTANNNDFHVDFIKIHFTYSSHGVT